MTTTTTFPSTATVDTVGQPVDSYIDNDTSEGSWSGVDAEPVVEWEGKMVRIRQKFMTVGVPLSFLFEGVPVVAIKRTSGKVDFYYIPTK